MAMLPMLFGLLLPVLGMRRLRRSRKRCFVFLMGLVSLGFVIAISGCVGGGFFNVTPYTYPITVTATSGTIQHSTIVSLTVQ
jgi:vacuolar-type H+-ATPase subunit I/STV1